MKKYLIALFLVITGVTVNAQTSNATAPADSIYVSVDKNASYPGGTDSLYKYVMMHLDFPASAREKKIGGKVLIRFVVEKDGTLSNFAIIRSPSEDLSAAVLKSFQSIPHWNPAITNGKIVRQVFMMPVTYNFGEDNQPTKTPADSSEVFTAVETSAEFPGGVEGLYNFLKKNVKYPKSAKKDNVQGKVRLTFIVEKNGTLTNIKVLQGVTPDIDAEAIRVIQLSPIWRPAQHNNQPVRQQYSLPIAFQP